MSGDREKGTSRDRVDVLIIAALKLEYDAVLEVETGAWPGSAWKALSTSTGLDAAVRTFQASDGRPLRVAVGRTLDMGEREATNAAVPLIKDYSPKCLAMSGVCAGRKGEVELGDVIVADRLWTYDNGQLVEEEDEATGGKVRRVKGDLLTYNLKPTWKHRAERFLPPADSTWLAERPISYEAQMDWVLAKCIKEEDFSNHADSQRRCPNRAEVLELLWRKKKWLQDGTLELTEEGRRHIQRELLKHGDALPEKRPFKVHVGPIASGSKVVKDASVFEELSYTMRKVLGLEMEAAAIGGMARLQGIPDMIVMKAAMDFANAEKSDHFKSFAARASAECLIAFLRENFVEADPDKFEDILEPGISEPPKYLSPSALLNARHEFVPFYEKGRSSLIEDLSRWCEDRERVVSIRLFHGQGGMGKTRLFIEWCRRLREKCWLAGFLVESADLTRVEELVAGERPALIVIDYAESRQDLRKVLETMVRRATGRKACLRVVLLARSVGDWWSSLRVGTGLVADRLKEARPTRLEPLAQMPEARKQFFLDAVEHFSRVLQRPVPVLPPLEWSDPQFARALYLLMAALAAVQGWPIRTKRLMKEVLKHEARFWRTHVQHLQIGDSEWRSYSHKTWRAVTSLTLRGGASNVDAARELIERVNDSADEWLLALLRDLYPGVRQGSKSTYISGMEPDLLGEATVLYTLRGMGAGADRFLNKVIEDEDESALGTCLEALGWLSIQSPKTAGRWIDFVIGQNLQGRAVAALMAAKAVGVATARAVIGARLGGMLEEKGTVSLAERLAAAGIPEYTISLGEVAAWVNAMLLRSSGERDFYEDMSRRAVLLNNLSAHQTELGRLEEALASVREATEMFKRLAQMLPDAHLPNYVIGLGNLGALQMQCEYAEDALRSLELAVELGWQVAGMWGDSFFPFLVKSLRYLSAQQGMLGFRGEALESAERARGIGEALVSVSAGAESALFELAESDINLGGRQLEAGQAENALCSVRNGIDLFRQLVAKNPDAYLSSLIVGLVNLGVVLKTLGDVDGALKSLQEAVDEVWPFFRSKPSVFSGLARHAVATLLAVTRQAGRTPTEEMRKRWESVN